MNKHNLEQTESVNKVSPRGKFQVIQKDLSLTLGGLKDQGFSLGGHPFDVCQVKVPAGKTNWPLHAHSAQWEFYLVQDGEGLVITSEGETPISAGDYFICPPGNAHQIKNPSGDKELVMLVIADNPSADVVRYPNTGNCFLKPSRTMLGPLGEHLELYAGEE